MVRLGPPAVGTDYFFGNQAALHALEAGIDSDNISLVVAPRRAGKTSLMRLAEQRLKERRPQAQTAFVDISYARSPWELLRQIALEPHEALIMGQVQDADIETALRSILEARRQSGADPFVLFIDEVDRPLQERDAEKWRDLINALARNGNTRLVLSMDFAFSQRVLELLPRALERRLRIIELKPWPAEQVRQFLEANLSDPAARHLIPGLAKSLAPAWPFEAILTMFELEEDFSHPHIDEPAVALDRAAEKLGGGPINHILDRGLGRKSIHAALYLLQALAQAHDVVQLDEAAARSDKRYGVHELDNAARRLAELGLVALDPKARNIRPATGLIGHKLALEFGA